MAGAGAARNNANKQLILKNCAPFTDCIDEINNTLVDSGKGIDLVMPMCNLRKDSDN